MREWIERHPYLTGSLILVILILFFLRRKTRTVSQGGTVYSGPSDALQAAALQSGTAIQTAQIASQTQVAGFNAAVNAKQLDNAASSFAVYQNAITKNYLTAAQLQLGLGNLNLSPSISPFGITIPIPGSNLQRPYPSSPVIPFPQIPGSVPIGSSIGPGQTPILSAQNPTLIPTVVNRASTYTEQAISASADQIALQAALNAAQNAPGIGTGQPIIVPGFTIPTQGYAPPSTIPTSSNRIGSEYVNSIINSLPNYASSPSLNPLGVDARTAAVIAAEQDYLTNPNSCHNRACA